jgi:hypothetical protein
VDMEFRQSSEGIINPALGANRRIKVVSRLPVVSAIISRGTVAISHIPTGVGSVTTARAQDTNHMAMVGRRQVMALAECRTVILDPTTHTDMRVAATDQDSKHPLPLTLAGPLSSRYASANTTPV